MNYPCTVPGKRRFSFRPNSGGPALQGFVDGLVPWTGQAAPELLGAYERIGLGGVVFTWNPGTDRYESGMPDLNLYVEHVVAGFWGDVTSRISLIGPGAGSIGAAF